MTAGRRDDSVSFGKDDPMDTVRSNVAWLDAAVTKHKVTPPVVEKIEDRVDKVLMGAGPVNLEPISKPATPRVPILSRIRAGIKAFKRNHKFLYSWVETTGGVLAFLAFVGGVLLLGKVALIVLAMLPGVVVALIAFLVFTLVVTLLSDAF